MARRVKTAKDLTQQDKMLADAVNRNRDYLDTAYAQINPKSTAKDFHKIALAWWNSPPIKEYTGRSVEPRKWVRKNPPILQSQEGQPEDPPTDDNPILFIFSFGDVPEEERIEWSPESPFKSKFFHDNCFNRVQAIVRANDILPTDPPEPTTIEDKSLLKDIESDKSNFDLSLTDWADDEITTRHKEWERQIALRVLDQRGRNTPQELVKALKI